MLITISILSFFAAAPAFAQSVLPGTVSDPLQFITIDTATTSLDVGFVVYLPDTPECAAYAGENCHNFPEAGVQTSDVWSTFMGDAGGDHFDGTYDFLLISFWDGAGGLCRNPIALTFDQCKALPSYLGVDIPITFSNPSAPVSSMVISVPPAAANTMTANVGDQIGDHGTLLVVALAAGIPLTFYVIHQLVALIPRRKRSTK